MTPSNIDLADLGWSPHFSRQVPDGLPDGCCPARIAAVHRDRLTALVANGPEISLLTDSGSDTGDYTVGDWVLYRPETGRIMRRMERKTLLSRRAAGTGAERQLIAANVDSLLIVTSCNKDFNIARLERYLALASSSGCLPVVVITKADLASDPNDYTRQAERLSPLVSALAIDARDASDIARLEPWCRPGETLALVGSSGVGKTTILNGLTGSADETQTIREDDAKGRHTTTARHLRAAASGGWIIDTPGMRALRLNDAAEGIDEVYADLGALEATCRFSDCQHETEPGCAIQAAIARGEISPDRLERWRKLRAEDRRNSETLAQSRARSKALAQLYREGQARGRMKRGN